MQASEGNELTSTRLLELTFVSDPRVAPGGEEAAAVATTIVPGEGENEPPRYRSEIRLFGVAGGNRQAVEPSYSDSHPRFSPDGRWLAFIRRTGKEEPAQLYLVARDAREGQEPRVLTQEPGGVESFEWHPSAGRLAYLAAREAKEKTVPVARTVDRLAHKLNGKGYLPAQPKLLRLVDLAGEVSDLPVGELDVDEFVWSADGSVLYLAAAADQAERDETLRRIWRLEAGGSGPQELMGPMRLTALSPGPHGRHLAFVAPAIPDQPSGHSSIWLLPADGGAPTRLTDEREYAPATGGDCRYGAYSNRPIWLDDRNLLVNLNEYGRSNMARIDVSSGTVTLVEEGDFVVTAFDALAGTIASVRETSARPGELYLAREGAPSQQASDFNGDLAERFGFREAVGPFRPRSQSPATYWRIDPRQRRADGAIVVQVHGGPHTNVGHGFYFEFQLLAARGYAVVYGNPQGSTSYGQEFATAILGRYGTVDADDILAFKDHALATNPVPGAPVHLTGGSYGGFMTNWLVAHTDSFRSAVTQRGICNFLSFYGTSDIGYFFSEREQGGNPWEDFERLWQQSPLRLAHRIGTPLLILHAESDLRCPVEQAQQLFVAVKRTGQADTELILFPEENHELSRSGRPDRRIRRLDAIVGWFESHP